MELVPEGTSEIWASGLAAILGYSGPRGETHLHPGDVQGTVGH